MIVIWRRNLAGLGLIGQLPQDLNQAAFLKTFSAAGNQFSGVLPDAWGADNTFPLLHSIDLTNNSLLGESSRPLSCSWPWRFTHCAEYQGIDYREPDPDATQTTAATPEIALPYVQSRKFNSRCTHLSRRPESPRPTWRP